VSARTAIIVGAGPAGLTAATELLDRSDVRPIILEMSDAIGGLCRTVNYKGNRIDIGGHRFFSKSDRVMQWWLARLPMERGAAGANSINYQGKSRDVHAPVDGPDPNTSDEVMLLRSRKSRIYFLRTFFDYPIQFGADTIAKLGLARLAKIGVSYSWAMLFANKHPKSLEDFFISRFGRELYLTFFKSYTEKVWGESCSKISAEWGAQRIKGLSIAKALTHFLKGLFSRKKPDISQKGTETSLIEHFLYPKFGPGQMWETVAQDVVRRGGEIIPHQKVTQVHVADGRIMALSAINLQTGEVNRYDGDFFFSTMPVQELIQAIDVAVPANVREVSRGLMYRDFITVGLLVNKLAIRDSTSSGAQAIKDNWIYIQEPDVKLGRLQIFNNWSPFMVADPSKTWLGLEYFCYESDPLWKMSDDEIVQLAGEELSRIGIIDQSEVIDATVIRMPKTYPAYFGTYDRFDEIRQYLDGYTNLFLIGRNGMHKYNNQDHSMLTAIEAVDNIVAGRTDKANIWDVNTEQDHHEEKE
jgi:protoporphyrinogen oxidase